MGTSTPSPGPSPRRWGGETHSTEVCQYRDLLVPGVVRRRYLLVCHSPSGCGTSSGWFGRGFGGADDRHWFGFGGVAVVADVGGGEGGDDRGSGDDESGE